MSIPFRYENDQRAGPPGNVPQQHPAPVVELVCKLPHSELSIFPDAGHGAIFQDHSAFLDQTLRFSAELT
jgi:hypothetical protein